MREALFILLVIAGLLAFTAFRYRRHIVAMYKLFQAAKSFGRLQQEKPGEAGEPAEIGGKLVSCSKCGTWVPEGRAIRLGRATIFCSAECLEKSAKTV